LTLLLVNMGEDEELVRQTVKKRGYTAPVLLDADRKVTATYRVTGTPTVYLVDRRGQLIGRAIGRREWAGEEGRRLLARLLGP
jgi:thioredoxin-related protein